MRKWTVEETATVLLSDVHLRVGERRDVERAVAWVLERHPQGEVVFVGDLFEFSTASVPEATTALRELLASNRQFWDSLARHVLRGGRVTLIAGNHDAALAEVGPHLEVVFGFPVRFVPWFARFGSIHVEHGHLFDRDNAPLHPLASYRRADDPLGVALMREVVVGLGAYEFAHAHQTTPAQALLRAARLFRWRLPQALLGAGGAFTRICWGAALGRWGRTRAASAEGRRHLAAYAVQHGVAEAELLEICAAAPTPTHARLATVFTRLYLDWVLACGLALAGGGGVALGGTRGPWTLALAAGCLAGKGLIGQSRYPSPLASLRRGATTIAEVTGAACVVFGHSHVEEEHGAYFNLGSFGYPSLGRRPYAVILDGAVERRYVDNDACT